MKKNSGLTLVELMITISILAVVIGAVWWMLEDASTDTYTLTDKVDVQNSVTSLMNVLQRDIQQASIKPIDIDGDDEADKNSIFSNISENEWVINNNIKYKLDGKTVTREANSETAIYYNIVDLEIKSTSDELGNLGIMSSSDDLGAKIRIVGGKNATNADDTDKTRYEMNSTFYTRNTISG